MSLSAAREGALLPGRKGNRVRLGGRAYLAPSHCNQDPASQQRLLRRREWGFPTVTPNSATSLQASQIRPLVSSLASSFSSPPTRNTHPAHPQAPMPLIPQLLPLSLSWCVFSFSTYLPESPSFYHKRTLSLSLPSQNEFSPNTPLPSGVFPTQTPVKLHSF